MPWSKIKCACLAAALLLPTATYASFGGSACHDFGCNFAMIGLILGTVGVPISTLIFAALNAWVCHYEKSKIREFFVGGAVGAAAYEVSAAGASLMATWGESNAGYHENYPLIGFALPYLASAIGSVLHARSAPRQHRE
jgi:uncharacterized BrkB/YihY/UPF0761 family membrane protein